MKVLAIDTTSSVLSIALVNDGKIAGSYHRMAHMQQSAKLIPCIDALLKKCKTPIRKIDLFAVSAGPGSFTGIRIGISTVKGLAEALGRKVVAVPTLDVIARNAVSSGGVIAPLLDAKKKKVYAAFYRVADGSPERISPCLLLEPHDLALYAKRHIKEEISFFGDAVELYRAPIVSGFPSARFLRQVKWYPNAIVVAKLGYALYREGKATSASALVPMYLYSEKSNITGW